jgi:hypothetical protein
MASRRFLENPNRRLLAEGVTWHLSPLEPFSARAVENSLRTLYIATRIPQWNMSISLALERENRKIERNLCKKLQVMSNACRVMTSSEPVQSGLRYDGESHHSSGFTHRVIGSVQVKS